MSSNPTTALAGVRHLIDLPEQVTTILDRLDRLDRLAATIEAPEAPEATNRRLDRGDDPLDVAADLRDYEQAKALTADAHRLIRDTREAALVRLLPQVILEQRDNIIEGPIREKVAALIDEARSHAEALASYAPTFDGGHVAAHGTPKQLKAYQAAVALQATYDALVSVYRALVTPKAAGNVYSPHIGGEGAWEHPEAVPAEHRGKHRRQDPHHDDRTPAPSSVLLIASQPAEAGYRLASIRELHEAYWAADAQARAESDARTRVSASFGG